MAVTRNVEAERIQGFHQLVDAGGCARTNRGRCFAAVGEEEGPADESPSEPAP